MPVSPSLRVRRSAPRRHSSAFGPVPDRPQPRALVVEQGWSRGALAAVRALSAAGWRVGVAAPQPRGLALASRSCHARHLVAPLQPSVDTFVASVAAVAEHGRYDVVFGGGGRVFRAAAARLRACTRRRAGVGRTHEGPPVRVGGAGPSRAERCDVRARA